MKTIAAAALLLSLLVSCAPRESGRAPTGEPASATADPSPAGTGTVVEEGSVVDVTEEPSTTDTVTTDRGMPPVPPVPPRVPSVRIESITGTNPLVARGRARTFENNVVLRVRAGNEILTQTSTTAVGDMGTFNPWSHELWITRMPASGKVLVDAIEYSAKDGSVASIDTREVPLTSGPMTVTLEFPLDDCTRFRAFQRSVPKTVSMARLLAEALVAGPLPSEKGASNPFPRGSAVKSAILRNGTLTVDFNERLRNVGGSCAAIAIRESVTRTMKRLPAVQRVIITAEGSEPLALQP